MGYSIGLIKIELTDSSSVQRWCGWDGRRPVGAPQRHWAQNRIIVRLVYLRFAGLLFYWCWIGRTYLGDEHLGGEHKVRPYGGHGRNGLGYTVTPVTPLYRHTVTPLFRSHRHNAVGTLSSNKSHNFRKNHLILKAMPGTICFDILGRRPFFCDVSGFLDGDGFVLFVMND